jgi:hypothetical protein
MYVYTISCEGNDGVGMAFASRRRVSSHHVQMRNGVCIEINEYHVNTHMHFGCILNMSFRLFCCVLLLHHAVWSFAWASRLVIGEVKLISNAHRQLARRFPNSESTHK